MKKIMLDPGHGGTDTGACGNGLVEKVLNLSVAKRVRDILISDYSGVEVKLSREADTTLDANSRVKVVNSYNPDICVSIHHNAADGKARGAEVIHAHYDQHDDALALTILSRLSKAGMPARRAFTKLNDQGKDWYFMIRQIWDSNTTAIITEGGFVDNVEDAKMLKDASFLEAEAKVIADSVAEFLQLQPKVVTEEQKLYIAIEKLKQVGVMNSPLFWTENAKVGKLIKGELAACLITQFADYLNNIK